MTATLYRSRHEPEFVLKRLASNPPYHLMRVEEGSFRAAGGLLHMHEEDINRDYVPIQES